MVRVRTWAALDVHVKEVRAAVFDVLSGELSERRLPGASEQVTGFISTPPRPARVVSAARVPSTEEEALRDLVRAREDVRHDLTRARHRLSKFRLRHGLRFEAAGNWTERHHRWLAEQASPEL